MTFMPFKVRKIKGEASNARGTVELVSGSVIMAQKSLSIPHQT